jgi:hypothetical protein
VTAGAKLAPSPKSDVVVDLVVDGHVGAQVDAQVDALVDALVDANAARLGPMPLT